MLKPLASPGLDSFRRQESIFIALNLLILITLFFLHFQFAEYWGKPTLPLILAVAIGTFLKAGEWLWIRRLSRPLRPGALASLTWASIALNIIVASTLALLTDREDTPYFVLMTVAILEAAFRFPLPAIIGVVVVVDVSLFWQVQWYFSHHPPLDVGEYFEAGINSLLFLVVGVVVWLLLADLRRKENSLANNVLELERTREQLLREEKLAAVGRLSSAIAHEIRNPVAMIASSIATAKQLTGPEREEMFGIASEEANRLSQLTTEFLDYARTRPPKMAVTLVADTAAYVADAARAHASQKGVQIEVLIPAELTIRADESQLQQALLNLVLNAIDASPAGGTINLGIHHNQGNVAIDVENSGSPIPESALGRIFEPFFTTKPRGTGLGLAIARNIARAQGGDLVLVSNTAERICFSFALPLSREES